MWQARSCLTFAPMNQRLTLIIAGISGLLAVALGAFGAHALEPTLLANGTAANWETASQYHFYHTIALVLTALLMQHKPQSKALPWAALLFTVGIVLFSGTLYQYAITQFMPGPVPPLGGLAFMAGWVMLGIGGLKKA